MYKGGVSAPGKFKGVDTWTHPSTYTLLENGLHPPKTVIGGVKV